MDDANIVKHEERLRRKGQSILRGDGGTPYVVGTSPDDCFNIRSRFTSPPAPELRQKAIKLWPFVAACGDVTAKGLPNGEAWADGFVALAPEMEIHRWESFVLACQHTLELMSHTEARARGYDEQFCRSLRTPDVTMLGQRTLAMTRAVDPSLMASIGAVVFVIMSDKPLCEEERDALPTRIARMAVEKVTASRKAEYDVIQKEKEIRYGQVLGASCANCGVVDTSHKKCSMCRTTYYCELACQRAHWNEHRKDCKPSANTKMQDKRDETARKTSTGPQRRPASD